VLFGTVRWHEGQFVPQLNAPADYLLGADDRLVFVAASYEDTVPAVNAPSTTDQAPADLGSDQAATAPYRKTRHILILGWNQRVAALIHELETRPDERFEVTVASMVSERARQAVLDDFGAQQRVTCRHVEMDYVMEAELRSLDPGGFDNVLLASSERLASGEEADTRAVVAYLLLEALLDGSDGGPQLLLELQDPDNEPLIRGRRAEVMVSPLILAHIVAQVALRRELRAVYDALFMAGGPEITLRDPGRYAMSGVSARFQALAAVVRARGDTLIGVLTADGPLLLSPPPDRTMALQEGDQLVVVNTA
jgi:ribosomal protein L32E